MEDLAVLGATNRPQPNREPEKVRQLGCGSPDGQSAPERREPLRLSREDTARLLLEPEARDPLTDRQLTIVTAWSRGATVAAVAETLNCTRQATSKSLGLALDKLQAFAAEISRG